MTLRNIMIFGPNRELLAEFNRQGVRFLIVGGVAVHFHAPERKFDDLDILIDPNRFNADRCVLALHKLGLNPLFLAAQLTQPKKQISLKLYHYADLVTPASDIDFAAEWECSSDAFVNEHPVRVASRELLKRMKSGTGCPKDADDIELLQWAALCRAAEQLPRQVDPRLHVRK